MKLQLNKYIIIFCTFTLIYNIFIDNNYIYFYIYIIMTSTYDVKYSQYDYIPSITFNY